MSGFVTLDGAQGLTEAEARMLAETTGAWACRTADAGRLRVFDLHCDTLDRLAATAGGVDAGDALGSFAEHDARLPRSRMSGLADNAAHVSLARMRPYAWCQCFAVFVPDTLQGDEAWRFWEDVHAFWKCELARNEERLVQARTAAQIDAALSEGRTAGMLTVEGASFLQDDLQAEARLDALAEAGVRMVTLTWNGQNALGSGHDKRYGLTGFGRAMVRELEERDIVVDVSHLNDAGFKDVCDAATRPFAASHSNARAVCGHPRNLEDWQLRELADCGGIAGLNFCRDFLSDVHADPTRDDVLRQVDHVLEVAGEHVLALGSDYDGCDVPSWLAPCDRAAELHGLLADQFGGEVADAVFFDNARRFFERL